MRRSPRDFFRPLAAGAPEPLREIPRRPSRSIHFFDPSNARMAAKLPELARQADVLLGNLEDAVPAERKREAREGLIRIANEVDLGDTPLWARVNSLDSPWCLDDLLELVAGAGARLEVLMLPKVTGPRDIAYADQLLAQLEAKHRLTRPLLLHAILETAQGVARVEEIALASPRLQGISLGPADLAASRRMQTTRVGGGHPDYVVRADPDEARPEAPRFAHQQDLWHYTLAKLVDACAAAEILPYYGPFGHIADEQGCEDQFRNAFLLGCAGAWTLHPRQLAIARRVFSPPPTEVAFALRVLAALQSGSGAAMLDGRMQDDATVRQSRVVVELARALAARDPELEKLYGFAPPAR
jgi:malyl-CoA/(S)-citramalyl-CoA lyase